jgi:hypothetical protein
MPFIELLLPRQPCSSFSRCVFNFFFKVCHVYKHMPFLGIDSLILFFIKLGIWLPLLLIIDRYSSLTRWFCFVVIARKRNVDAIYVNGTNCFIVFLQHAECIFRPSIVALLYFHPFHSTPSRLNIVSGATIAEHEGN